MAVSATHVPTEPFLVYPDSPDAFPPGVGEGPGVDASDFLSTLLDIVNPLQHIPLVSNLYREITGDEIGGAARMIGGALFGGPVGFAAASGNVILEQASGDDVFGHAVAMFSGDDSTPSLFADSPAAPAQDAPQRAEIDSPATAQTIVETAAREAPGEIVVPGQPVVPSLASAKPAPQPAPPNTTPAAATATPTPAATKAAPPVPATAESNAPGWIAAAMADAKNVTSALQSGDATVSPTAQPWVARAMLDALDKYESLARARGTASDPIVDRAGESTRTNGTRDPS